jgi:hypothetical protein
MDKQKLREDPRSLTIANQAFAPKAMSKNTQKRAKKNLKRQKGHLFGEMVNVLYSCATDCKPYARACCGSQTRAPSAAQRRDALPHVRGTIRRLLRVTDPRFRHRPIIQLSKNLAAKKPPNSGNICTSNYAMQPFNWKLLDLPVKAENGKLSSRHE